jgi:hypothetical protein
MVTKFRACFVQAKPGPYSLADVLFRALNFLGSAQNRFFVLARYHQHPVSIPA